MYQWNTRIRYSEVGTNGLLTMCSLIDYFQDCVNLDADDRKVGFWELSRKGWGWILLTWQIEVNRYPAMGEEVVISTAPYSFKGCFGNRNFFMHDKEGNLLACADSSWMLMDFANGKPVRDMGEIVSAYELEEQYPMEYSRAKIVLGDKREEMEHFHIGRNHLDTNNHVNNGQYVAMAQQYIPADRMIRKMRVEYRKQAMLGDEVIPLVSKEDAIYKVAIQSAEDTAYAVLLFETGDEDITSQKGR